MKKVKVGIIGIGGIAQVHIPALTALPWVEIVAACDINPEKLKSNLLSAEVKRYTDYRELLADPQIDAVHICTPNYLHSLIAVAALAAGKNVFCEKPDAVSVSEAEKMERAAAESGKLLMVMRNNRFLDSSRFLKAQITEGKLGEIYAARCGWQRRRGIPGKGGWFTTKAQSGGGPLIDLGVHMIDLAVYLMGNPRPVSVSGCTYRKFAENESSDSIHSSFGEKQADGVFDVEDLAMGFIRFDNGACLQIEFSWASNIEKEIVFVELRGDAGGAAWSNLGLKIFGEENGALIDLEPKFVVKESGHARAIRHFYDVLLNGEKPIFDMRQGVDMIRILEGIYRSAETGREVVL